MNPSLPLADPHPDQVTLLPGQEGMSEASDPPKLTLGDYAYQVIKEQYQRLIQPEAAVVADRDPEALHQMRVGTRRLRTALQVFQTVVRIPKVAGEKRLRNLARELGAVRDLDVQLASLTDDYGPNLNKPEQKKLATAIAALKRKRKKIVAQMQQALRSDAFRDLKAAYEAWLVKPRFTPSAQLPIATALPDLLSPLLSDLLLHPGWWVARSQVLAETDLHSSSSAAKPLSQTAIHSAMLHDLRKTCKHVRYQAEFFTAFYDRDFSDWVKTIRKLQDRLGEFQDTHVLLDLLHKHLGPLHKLPDLQATIAHTQATALADWETIRQDYLDATTRDRLRQMVLRPKAEGVEE